MITNASEIPVTEVVHFISFTHVPRRPLGLGLLLLGSIAVASVRRMFNSVERTETESC